MGAAHGVAVVLAELALGGVLAAAETPPIPTATPEELARLIGGGRWVIVEFGGEHCIPCKAMQPILQTLCDRLGDKW